MPSPSRSRTKTRPSARRRRRKTSSNSADVLARLTKLHPKLIDLSLDRVETLLARLGDPHLRLPPVVHVAGTNGKGSVVAFLRAILEAAGYRVHAYTSPHLARFNERIRVAGRIIENAPLTALLEECETANADGPVTFFEITTAAAFLAFARTPADIVLLETGLGGRLDATNLIARPAATVITPISLDHQDFLGHTLAAIAGEKAGILKAGVPGIIAAQPPEAMDVIAARARALGAPLSVEGRDWTAAATPDGMTFNGRALPRPGLVGAHQIANAGIALACLEQLDGFPVPETALAAGLRGATWPARLQRLAPGGLPEGWELWLDGGHNPSAGQALAEQAAAWTDKPLDLVCGMLNSKDPAGFLAPLRPFIRHLRTIAIPDETNSRTAGELAEIARNLGFDATPAPSVDAALAEAEGPPARLLICGSLYLAGTVLRTRESESPA